MVSLFIFDWKCVGSDTSHATAKPVKSLFEIKFKWNNSCWSKYKTQHKITNMNKIKHPKKEHNKRRMPNSICNKRWCKKVSLRQRFKLFNGLSAPKIDCQPKLEAATAKVLSPHILSLHLGTSGSIWCVDKCDTITLSLPRQKVAAALYSSCRRRSKDWSTPEYRELQ